ncbi:MULTISPECIES: helix-turn-helix domain-containing protein [Bacillus]|uniref:helix-turn-helix domain-containing protein n=1 Tax=Bacillus TaxID=1386 RepID=UPI0003308861|nr:MULTISPECIES: helix-turn-helix transcriptional regulator [Bacillus]ARC32105.1 XRE family transcriptional regulator [Bacillus sp. FDAARGOS_235]EOP40078.1 hypothetical protein IKI_02923 [Bacillus toyonensis]MBY7100530.1 helix-turn-helix transcriptional regulator [Bacillus sp. 6YEL31]MCU4770888.1 helix-turn-helix domain-containing protein [Bacillus toyonensis]PEI60993.1 XRE family transcriptional regulator [Bacillus toyonensis]
MNNTFGEKLKELRVNKGLTVNQLALYSDVSSSQISRIENGKRGIPKPETIKKLAEALQVHYEELMEAAGYVEKNNETTPKPIPPLSEKDELDIAKRMDEIKKDLQNQDGLMFSGEPMSEEAVESLLDAMEYIVKQTKVINKKYVPKKYRNTDDN